MPDLKRGAALIDRVRYAYPSATDAAIEMLSWSIEEGTFTVVTGASGAGKSTQLRLLNGLVPHFSGGRFAGQVSVGGRDTRFVPTRDLSRQVGFLFQEPDGLSIGGRVVDEIAFGMEQIGVPVVEMRRAVEEAMTLLGVEHLRSRDIATLSGGERQRVAIAAAMSMKPAMLVLDEPTSQLDPAGADDLVQAIQQLNEEQGVTVVLAEHRLERVLPHADELRVLVAGGPSIDGDPRSVLAGAGAAFAPSLFRAGQFLGWDPPPVSVKEGRLLRAGSRLPADLRAGEETSPPGSVVVSVAGVDLAHEHRPVLKGVEMALRQGEIVALMGPNGSGKTTLLRSLVGLHRVSGGSIAVLDRRIDDFDKQEIGRTIGYLPQRARSVLFCESVQEEIDFSLRHRHASRSRLTDLLEEFDLIHVANRHPLDLSIGEQERLALAATLAGDPPVLLLDEPTRGLDRARKERLAASLRRRAASGQVVVEATHDVEFAAETASRVLLLGGGEIIADGSPRTIFDGSMVYGTQINKVFGHGMLIFGDVQAAVRAPEFGDTSGVPE
ncbi:MAG: ATP-binding cassette domain-containing protein [Thermomicrobiales bacterium]|nr:ATP-binding cassette domain-containing protein [Thermomicrobiales bacterium]